MPQQIVVLGAGISGLATAWYLKQCLGSGASVNVVEKSERAGGWIQTLQADGFLFEQGPRSCRSKGAGRETLALVENLGLQDQVLVPHSDATQRYLYESGNLKRLPKQLWEIPFNSLTRGWFEALWRDWRNPKRAEEDESIHSFFSRRLGSRWADVLIDPFVLGIYAGDSKQLSIRSCFPLFDEWEKKRGSLLRGAWHHRKPQNCSSAFIQAVRRFPLFSFKDGMETLPRVLAHELKECLLLGNGVSRLDFHQSGIKVTLENGECIIADLVISTLPAYALGSVLHSSPEVISTFKALNYATVGIVNLGFDASVSAHKGFGYLVPTGMKELVLGCVWDSCIFPQQNKENQTRLTVMLGGMVHPEIEHMTDEEMIAHALKALHRHMGVRQNPKTVQVKKAKQAIPQFEVGHERWKEELKKKISTLLPRLILSGNAWTGVSINDCIAQARCLAHRVACSLDL